MQNILVLLKYMRNNFSGVDPVPLGYNGAYVRTPQLRHCNSRAIIYRVGTMLEHGSLDIDGVDEIQAHRHAMRHSAAHVMADAVLKLFPEAKMGIGPPTHDGFYYDFEVSRPFTPEDLEEIEKLMKETIESGFPFKKEDLSRADAEAMFSDQPYKIELIEGLPEDAVISIYRHDNFVDLCQGPHVHGTSDIPAMKLLSVAGAYWRGDEKRPMLQRIYGTAFESESGLEEHLQRLEEAERRDHRTLGRQLNLFSVHDEIGPGLIVWHPKGGRVRSLVEDYWKNLHYRLGYDVVYSPHIGRAQLWETSGHLDFYQENMYAPVEVDDQQYYLKPMNCPFHISIFKNALHSYRELPLRFAELGTRSEEHTSELQSLVNLVCRFLLEKKIIDTSRRSILPLLCSHHSLVSPHCYPS